MTRASRELSRYVRDPALPVARASVVVRTAFLTAFAAQAVAAALVASVVAVAAGRQDGASAALAGVAVAVSAAQVALGAAVTAVGLRSVRRAGDAARAALAAEAPTGGSDAATRLRAARASALHAALLSAILASTPAWFAAFLWVTGQGAVGLAATAGLLALGYALGVLQAGGLARAVTWPPRPSATEAPARG